MITGALLLLAAAGVDDIDCRDAENLPQMGLNICAYRDFQRADAALNAQWKLTAAAIKARDADVDRTYDRQPDWFETLLAGQRAWLTWRDQQCTLESFDARGGSMQPMLESGCKARLTDDRTRQLRSLIEVE